MSVTLAAGLPMSVGKLNHYKRCEQQTRKINSSPAFSNRENRFLLFVQNLLNYTYKILRGCIITKHPASKRIRPNGRLLTLPQQSGRSV